MSFPVNPNGSLRSCSRSTEQFARPFPRSVLVGMSGVSPFVGTLGKTVCCSSG